jgi:leucyl-tRNA synthetase
LYSRFITKALHRAGLIQFDEPFTKLRHVGMILGLDGQKMSKSRGNVINPDEIVARYGADTLRLYEMFMGPMQDKKAWDMHGVEGCHRFLSRVWHLASEIDKKILDGENEKIWGATQELILKVENDIKEMKFNTSVAKMMEWLNEATNESRIWNLESGITKKNLNSKILNSNLDSRFKIQDSLKIFLRVLAPFAPHLAEELNYKLADKLSDTSLINYKSIHLESWPVVAKDTIITTSDEVFLVEVNGRVIEKIASNFLNYSERHPEPRQRRGEGSHDEQIRLEKYALSLPKIKAKLAGKPIKKTIFVPNKLINFVI